MNEYVQRLTALQPTCIALFGSTATGHDHLESDLDLVIIGGQLPERQFDRLDVLNRLKIGIPVSIDTFAYTETEFEQMLQHLNVTALDCLYEGRPLLGERYFERLHQDLEQLLARGLNRSMTAWAMPVRSP